MLYIHGLVLYQVIVQHHKVQLVAQVTVKDIAMGLAIVLVLLDARELVEPLVLLVLHVVVVEVVALEDALKRVPADARIIVVDVVDVPTHVVHPVLKAVKVLVLDAVQRVLLVALVAAMLIVKQLAAPDVAVVLDVDPAVLKIVLVVVQLLAQIVLVVVLANVTLVVLVLVKVLVEQDVMEDASQDVLVALVLADQIALEQSAD
jgi:hypothetical protein